MSMMMMERKWKRQNIGQNHSKMKDIQMVESIKIGFKSLQTQKHLNQSVFNREGINTLLVKKTGNLKRGNFHHALLDLLESQANPILDSNLAHLHTPIKAKVVLE
jgi:hypothetical protein